RKQRIRTKPRVQADGPLMPPETWILSQSGRRCLPPCAIYSEAYAMYVGFLCRGVLSSLALSGIALLTCEPLLRAQEKIDFVRDIQPIFAKSCQSCHGPKTQMGGLRLDAKDPALAGGQSGKVI